VSLGKLINLEILNIYGNKLKFIPSELGNLVNLNYFYICPENLKILLTEILNLKGLRILDKLSNILLN
jgi:Leucine-rich repeat (LRR) protein